MLKHSYTGVGERIVHAYAGNFVVSFALYFACLGAAIRFPYPRPLAAVAVFALVTAFEVTNGFGVMTNVYDPFDIAAMSLSASITASESSPVIEMFST